MVTDEMGYHVAFRRGYLQAMMLTIVSQKNVGH